MGQVPYLDVAGTFNKADGSISLFVLNRDLSNAHQLEVNWEDKTAGRLVTSLVLTGNDLKAVNGFDAPQKVTPQAAENPSPVGTGQNSKCRHGPILYSTGESRKKLVNANRV